MYELQADGDLTGKVLPLKGTARLCACNRDTAAQ